MDKNMGQLNGKWVMHGFIEIMYCSGLSNETSVGDADTSNPSTAPASLEATICGVWGLWFQGQDLAGCSHRGQMQGSQPGPANCRLLWLDYGTLGAGVKPVSDAPGFTA